MNIDNSRWLIALFGVEKKFRVLGFIQIIGRWDLNPLLGGVPFLCHLKTWENREISVFSRGVKREELAVSNW